MKFYGIKDPDIENKRSIIKKAQKYKLDSTNIVTVSSSDFLNIMKGIGIPDGAVYDRNGKYIEYRQTDSACNAGLFQFIPALNLTDEYNQPDKLGLETVLKKFRDLEGKPLGPAENADFYLLIYWTVWTGRLNKDHVKIWEDLANGNKNCKIKVIKVNMDIQQYWEQNEQQKIFKAMTNQN